MLWVGPLCAVAVDAGAGYVWCKLPSHYVLSPVIDKSCQPARLTAHLTGPQLSLGTRGNSRIHPERREPREGLPQTLGSSHFQPSGMCLQSRSSDADLGWLWAPPMNLSCMAIKIKANKERFGLRTCQTWNCPRVHSVPSLTSQQFGPEWWRGPGTLQSFQWPLIKSDIFTPLQIIRPPGHWPSRALLGQNVWQSVDSVF